MKNLLKSIAICVVALTILNITSAGYAQDMGKKIYRGVVNVLTGWVEIPKNMYETSIEEDSISAVTTGVGKGVWMMIVRTAAGVYETATFLFPMPKGYEPVLKPEFVFKGKEAT